MVDASDARTDLGQCSGSPQISLLEPEQPKSGKIALFSSDSTDTKLSGLVRVNVQFSRPVSCRCGRGTSCSTPLRASARRSMGISITTISRVGNSAKYKDKHGYMKYEKYNASLGICRKYDEQNFYSFRKNSPCLDLCRFWM